MLCIPVAADQGGVASRLAAAGAGLYIENGQVTQEKVSSAVGRLLAEPTFTHHAARVGKLMKFGGGATKAADLIFLLLETGGQGEHLKNYLALAPVGLYKATYAVMFGVPLLCILIILLGIWRTVSFVCHRLSGKKVKTN